MVVVKENEELVKENEELVKENEELVKESQESVKCEVVVLVEKNFLDYFNKLMLILII